MHLGLTKGLGQRLAELKDVTAPGLSADARFIMAYDAARTLSLLIVRSSG
jgi:hypothetical protein